MGFKGSNLYRHVFCDEIVLLPFEKESTPKVKNVLPRRVYSSFLKRPFFRIQQESKQEVTKVVFARETQGSEKRIRDEKSLYPR